MNRFVAFALHQRVLIVLMLVAMVVAGGFAFLRLNIEAYPDPVPPAVEIVTQNTGISAEEIERSITIPIEVGMAGIPHITSVRTISLFGLSDVKIQFSYDYTFEQAQQQVINRLSQIDGLPPGVQPGISPVSPIGEVYRYRVVGPPGYSVMDLKTIQDWIVERRIKAVPGVIDVTGWGGKTRTYEVVIDNEKLVAEGVTVANVIDALGKSNANVGGQTVKFGPQNAIVRGVALIHSVSDMNGVLVGTRGGAPIKLGDVATVKVGNQPRLGIAGQDGDDDIVQGTVLMYRGAQSSPTITAVENAIQDINSSGILPPGVKLERIYDRSGLIALTTRTVIHNMIEGILLIFFLQWLFLGNLRSALIVAATIPFALCFAVLILTLQGESANLLSVGALDFGLIVDATVIMVENIYRHLVARSHAVEHGAGHYTPGSRLSTILSAASEVNRGIFFAAAIIIASFIPLFTLSGVEGHIFGPMAKTYAYAIAGGLIATFTVSPVLAALLLPDRLSEVETWIVRKLRAVYQPAVRFAIANRLLTLGSGAALLMSACLATWTLGVEFLPKLEEGNMWIRATMPASVSLEEGQRVVNEARRIIRAYPEVETVVSQHGRPDDGTDATGFFNAEFFTPLKPSNQWPAGMTKAKLTADMQKKLADRFPGVEFAFSQYIQDNVEEAASGVKGANSIKLFGPDLETLEKTGKQIEAVMAKVPGITDLGMFELLGQPTVQVVPDRDRAARYGLTPEDINRVVRAAIGGEEAGDLYERSTDRHFPIVVRLQPGQRDGVDSIRRITVGAPGENGAIVQVPLSEVAEVKLTTGPSFVYREHQERYVPIKFAVRGRDLGGAVSDAQRAVAEQVKLPPGYHLEWAGELGNLENAVSRLQVVIPISLGLILLLLFLNFGSARDMLLAASVMPMALIGGVLALVLTGTSFSISAAIGFVALLGISVMDGIIVLSAFNQAIDEGMARARALAQACSQSLRPVVMTCLVAAIGLVPAAFSSGIGSQVQKPLAIVVVGGMMLAPLLILLVLPVLIDLFSRHEPVLVAKEGAIS
ncbi:MULTISPECIES: CusA/CzcA family heavy metal efflux RND transporter [unclassified Sphingomonas]|jgi:heavy metal efflux system protein|nr:MULTISPECIES: CusA/CzcA family heavy metal efflux RND transporter [unclassified Sphingomonas]